MKDNKCISCGAIIPEGRQVCPNCDNKKVKDKQSSYIKTQLVTKCIICGNDVISVWNNAPKVCEDCKKAINYAKKLMEQQNKTN